MSLHPFQLSPLIWALMTSSEAKLVEFSQIATSHHSWARMISCAGVLQSKSNLMNIKQRQHKHERPQVGCAWLKKRLNTPPWRKNLHNIANCVKKPRKLIVIVYETFFSVCYYFVTNLNISPYKGLGRFLGCGFW